MQLEKKKNNHLHYIYVRGFVPLPEHFWFHPVFRHDRVFHVFRKGRRLVVHNGSEVVRQSQVVVDRVGIHLEVVADSVWNGRQKFVTLVVLAG